MDLHIIEFFFNRFGNFNINGRILIFHSFIPAFLSWEYKMRYYYTLSYIYSQVAVIVVKFLQIAIAIYTSLPLSILAQRRVKEWQVSNRVKK